MQLFKLCCNVFCELVKWFFASPSCSYTNMRAENHEIEWTRLSVTVESPSSRHTFSGHFQQLAVHSVVSFTKL